MKKKHYNYKIAFFGSGEFSIFVLDEMEKEGLLPSLMVCAEDKPKGRGLTLTKPVTKIWAEKRKIECFQPKKLENCDLEKLKNKNFDIFIVVAYGKIIPKKIYDMPKYKTLNVHPSLLPKYRGASPIQTTILNDDKDVGVTIIQIDEKMDNGPIIAKEKIEIVNWPPRRNELEKILAETGGKLISKIIPLWIQNKIPTEKQNDNNATYSKIISKEDGLIDINGDMYKNFLKYQALYGWPGTYFFTQKNTKKIRVLIKEAEFIENKFIIKKVVPEGKKEMNYSDFSRV